MTKPERQITFWVEKGKIKEIDKFLEKKGIKSRSKFIIECMELVFINPFLLDKKIVKNIQLDRELLYNLIKLFDEIPCEFDFKGSKMEESRIEEIKKEIASND